MQPLTINDLTPLDAYAQSYKEARQRIIQVKAPRRVMVGESIAFLFENRETPPVSGAGNAPSGTHHRVRENSG